jgi:hypothetical protein
LRERLEYKIVGLAILFLLCWIGYSPLEGRSVIVWSDDFNDGNYDGWTICSPSWGNPPSNWSAANNCLQIEQDDYGSISHPSNVTYGTWSFDFKANGTQVAIGVGVDIAFVSNDVHDPAETPTAGLWSCYGFKAHGASGGTGFRLYLLKWHGGVRTDIGYNSTVLPVAGWHHVDVTRNTTGYFRVYHNGSLVIQGVDTELTASKLFVVSLADWLMIDNVVVDDEPIPLSDPTTTTPPPTTPTPIDWVSIGIIGASAVVIIAVVVIILKRR